MKAVVAHSSDIDSQDALEEVLATCKKELDGAVPRLGLLFAGIDHEFQLILDRIADAFPALSLVGCTTDGEFSTDAGFHEDSLALLLFVGEDFNFATGVADRVSDDTEQRTATAIREAASDLSGTPGLMIVTPSSLTVNTSRVLRAVAAELGDIVPVVGATAGDQWRFDGTAQFHGRDVFNDAVPFILFDDQVPFAFGVETGWSAIGSEGTVTDADDVWVRAINGAPAADFYRHYLGDVNLSHLGEYPLAVQLENGEFVLRSSYVTDPEKGWLQFGGEVPVGSTVRITHATRDKVIGATTEALGSAQSRFGEREAAVALCFSCAGRKQVLGSRTGEEAAAVTALLGDIPAIGFYGYGEICPNDSKGPTRFHNETFVAVLLGEKSG